MKKNILILSANPRSDLHLDREIKDLNDAIKRNKKFNVQIELAVNAESIENLILENQPLIVHFCGHGNGNEGLVFVNKEGIEQYLSNEELANIFESYAEEIECVLLNACYTEVQADAISKYIPYVIGTSREILDEVAHYFSIGFYKGIAKEQPIETCYEWGYISIKSNLKNAAVVTSIDEINSKSRKLKVINDGTVSSAVKPLEIVLKYNKRLDSQFASNVSPKLEQEFIEEGRRKRYKDNLRNILDNFGQRIIHREKQISDFELKQRQTLINKVQDFWIKGFLKPSLYFNTATDIDNEHPSGQILRPLNNLEVIPFDIEQSYDSVKNTDITNQISDGQTLLILGEPGSGKTIALLQLAERLVAESLENSKKPIPVVFNLSSWVEKQQSLEEWLIEELRDKYQVPKAWSKPWIENQELTLLLDGLDEVKVNYRNACVRAIRKFSNTYQATEMVVCSRIQDYEALADRLLLSSVVCIQPLSRKQLLDFLEKADDSLAGLKTVIKQDSGIFQFATTPLILNMMTWTYHGWSTEQCYEQFRIPGDREFNLFESYIDNNLARINSDKKYSKDKVLNWLNWLATTMVQESKIIFLIEKMQPNLLKRKVEKAKYFIFNFLHGWIAGGLVSWLIYLLFLDGLKELMWDFSDGGLPGLLFFGVFSILFFGLCFGWIGGVITIFSKEIILFEQISWSWQKVKHKKVIYPMFFLLIVWLLSMLMEWGLAVWVATIITYITEYPDLIEFVFIPIFGLVIIMLNTVFIRVLNNAISVTEVQKRTIPNQGIWMSRKNAFKIGRNVGLVIGLVVFLSFCLVSVRMNSYLSVWDNLRGTLTYGLIEGLKAGIIFGLILGILNGGITCFQHFNLRRILHKKSRIPWNYARFLNYAAKLRLMKKVGGGYIFYHRMLMEHFAQRHQPSRKPVPVTSRQTPQLAQVETRTRVRSSNINNPLPQSNNPVLDRIICSNCSHQNPTTGKFCTKCGSKLVEFL